MGGYESERDGRKEGQKVVRSVCGYVTVGVQSGYACRRECVHAREIAQCRCVSKRKWRKEHAFNLYLREGICVLVCFQVGLLCMQI